MSFIKVESKNISIGGKKPSIELSSQLTQVMYRGIMDNFEAEGKPKWTPLTPRYKKQRIKQGFGPGPILNRKRGNLGLKGGIIEAPSDDKAQVGERAGIPYAAIHQFGGNIDRKPFSGTVQLRTNKKGKLKRQKGYKNLAVFAKNSHKLKTERKFSSSGWTVKMPARPYLAFTSKMFRDIRTTVKKFFSS